RRGLPARRDALSDGNLQQVVVSVTGPAKRARRPGGRTPGPGSRWRPYEGATGSIARTASRVTSMRTLLLWESTGRTKKNGRLGGQRRVRPIITSPSSSVSLQRVKP